MKGTSMQKAFNKFKKVSDNVMELDVKELNNYQKQLKADRAKNTKNKFQDLINANKIFKTLFIEPKSFVMATEKSVMINLFGLKFFVPQNMAKLNEKNKQGKTYSSITINREGNYKVGQSQKVSEGVYATINEQEVPGDEIITGFYDNLKQE